MSAIPRVPEPQRADAHSPRIIYVGEFPPSNHHGGAILVKRLLDSYPTDRLTVLTSTNGMEAARATGLFECRHIVMRVFERSSRTGVKLFVRTANALGLGLVALRIVWEIKRNRGEALITIVQGRFFYAAALAGWLTRTPHITMVHDNFVSVNSGPSNLLRSVLRWLTRQSLRNAAYIYAVSPEMQRLVFKESGRVAEIQLPSTTKPLRRVQEPARQTREDDPVILFAGTIGYTVRDCLELLAELIANEKLKARLYLYTNMTDDEARLFARDSPNIVCMGWVAQSQLQEALRTADILFLPYSFLESSREAVETAFPSKIADYLSAARPILVFGPRYSSLVRYASEQGFAEIVDEFSPEALAFGVEKTLYVPRYKEKLASRACEVVSANHDIQMQQQQFHGMLERTVRAARGQPR